LAENYGVDPEITYLLDNREVYFVPIVNPDGFLYNESTNPNGGGMWRKNRRNNGGSYGVDPNRNYPYEWGLDSGSSGSPSSETYRGPYAASEPEVQAMIALINDHQFDLRQSWHSYSELTLYPWGYTTADTPDEELFRDIAAEMVKYNGYAPGQPGDVLYIVSGGTFDWDYGAQGEHEKIFGFTNEIGHSGDGFWPPESRRQQLFEDNLWPSLYMIQISGSLRAVQFSHSPAPFTPDFYSPVEVQTIPTGYEGTAIDPASVTLHYRLNGGEFVDQPMTATGVPGEYGSSIPAQAVGSVVEYFLTANDVGGHTGSSPFGAPLNLHYYEIGESFEHTMEAERGWTVGASDDDATTGVWVRVDPVPTGCQPGDDHSADGTLCWITGQHPGGSDGANDVDSGKTTLFSPSYDFSGATSAVFSYWKWYSNDQGADPNNDWWDVDLSNDGGNSWISLEHTTTSSNAWVQESFDLFDHVGEAGVLQLRFIASDEGSGSLVEGGVDDFLLAGIFDTTGDDGLSVSFVDRLHQNNPNPFNPKTEIRFNLAEEGPALLRVFDSRGRVIRVLAEGEHAAGEHLLSWDGRDVTGHPLPSGVYFYRLETRDRVASKKMVLIK
ncbi:MAG: M14 family zinc carboxypeptidase, partial [Candidatus Krumholzibacteria bacterium]|nr:M14 family zinc carboxypeptidase [Candidatus Krumholzibacteria bacterium]